MQLMIRLEERAIDRPNVARVVADQLREAIVDGRIAAGSRINEVRLARTLEVSRTPLREALMHLCAEGTVKSVPRRGFFVRPLSLEEFEDIYVIRAILDPEALKLAGTPDRDRLERLEKLNRKLSKADSAARRIALDNAWHLELVSACRNQVLVDLIRHFMARTRRYEAALLRERSNAQITVAEHKRILAALRADDIDSACTALRQNMESGRQPIIDRLRARSPRDGK
jgi:DNA-binding GntR family transcriptional regulator